MYPGVCIGKSLFFFEMPLFLPLFFRVFQIITNYANFDNTPLSLDGKSNVNKQLQIGHLLDFRKLIYLGPSLSEEKRLKFFTFLHRFSCCNNLFHFRIFRFS